MLAPASAPGFLVYLGKVVWSQDRKVGKHWYLGLLPSRKQNWKTRSDFAVQCDTCPKNNSTPAGGCLSVSYLWARSPRNSCLILRVSDCKAGSHFEHLSPQNEVHMILRLQWLVGSFYLIISAQLYPLFVPHCRALSVLVIYHHLWHGYGDSNMMAKVVDANQVWVVLSLVSWWLLSTLACSCSGLSEAWSIYLGVKIMVFAVWFRLANGKILICGHLLWKLETRSFEKRKLHLDLDKWVRSGDL